MRLSTIALLFVWLTFVACGSDTDTQTQGDTTTDTNSDIQTADQQTSDTVEQDTAAPPIDWDAVFTQSDWQDDGKRRLVVFHTNDLHSHINGTGPLHDYSPAIPDNDATIGGFSRLATLLKRERNDLPPGAASLTLDAGDFTSGTPFGALSRPEGVELKLMEMLGYDATTLGNHELDWSPEGVAEILTAGLSQDSHLKVLASNLIFSEDPEDDAMEALMGQQLLPHMVLETDNGLRIGLFGLLGENAYSLAPHAAPVEVEDPAVAAQAAVDILRNEENVDLVIAVSHSGVSEGDAKGEDETIAANVDGIDVIISGHTHTLMPEPTIINDTIIVQAACYSSHLGKLVLVETDEGFELESWNTLPVDDSSPGLPEVQDVVDEYRNELDGLLFEGFEHGYASDIAHAQFTLAPLEFAESNLGNLVADAVRWAASTHSTQGPIQVAFEANGVIRGALKKGETGRITLADAFRVVPLGLGIDSSIGYPILQFYVTAHEIRLALEVICGIAPMMSDSFFLQVSGLKFDCDFEQGLFEQVQDIHLLKDDGTYDSTPLDTSEANDTLYPIATNLYIAQMLSVLKSMSAGLLAIELKDNSGIVHEELASFVIQRNDGLGELKLWQALYEYLLTFDPDDTELPAIPDEYENPQGRIPTIPDP